MNIIIPLGGKGERFAKNGYIQPKPLIPIFEKCMIDYVLDNIKFRENDNIYIIYNNNLNQNRFAFQQHIETYFSKKYPNYKNLQLIELNYDTKGAAETLYIGLNSILNPYVDLIDSADSKITFYHKKCLIIDCDTFYTQNIVDIFDKSHTNMVFYTKNTNPNPIYSYIELDDTDKSTQTILKIREKQKISDNANTGAYAFIDIHILYEYCKSVVLNNITFNNEPYTSCVINEMLKMDIHFSGYELEKKKVFSLGTPTELENFKNNMFAFLLDLDGTLVLTEDIYFKVWYDILEKYRIELTSDIFKRYIQGNTDKYVISSLLKDIDIDLSELSKLKDDMFIKHISNIQIIDGVIPTLQSIQMNGYKCSIVTNCNRRVANEILKYTGIDKYVDFVITSNDCVNGKPNSEPYFNAIANYCELTADKCIVIEDSKTGILAGKCTNPRILIGIETIYNSEELLNYEVDFSIKNYTEFNIDEVVLYDKHNNIDNIKKMIKNSMHSETILDISEIHFNKNKLKGGFIADVMEFSVHSKSYVLKYENKHVNNLSIMANKLDLYGREYYFYQNISNYINVKIPKFIGLLKDDELNDMGLILENMFENKNFKINLNLNVESIDVSLKIIDRMARMHSKFWNKNLSKMFPLLKKPNDFLFLNDFVAEKYPLFKTKWENILTPMQFAKLDSILADFRNIQERLSSNTNNTFVHGDIKSPNIFYDTENGNEPYFLDFQHCCNGKGTMDLMFFLVEGFDITNIKLLYGLFKNYYYKKIVEYGVISYSFEDYERDIIDSITYVPFFTAIWFGSLNDDELIDKNWIYFFLKNFCCLLDCIETGF